MTAQLKSQVYIYIGKGLDLSLGLNPPNTHNPSP
jgi:hypothetical protein